MPPQFRGALLLLGLSRATAYPHKLPCEKATALLTDDPLPIMGQPPTATGVFDSYFAGLVLPRDDMYEPGATYAFANPAGPRHAMMVNGGSLSSSYWVDDYSDCEASAADGKNGDIVWTAPSSGQVTIAVATAEYYGSTIMWEKRTLSPKAAAASPPLPLSTPPPPPRLPPPSPLPPYVESFPFDISAYEDNRTPPQPDGAVLFLRVDEHNIYVAMQAHAPWVAAGFNPSHAQMAGSDIVVCGVHDGELIARDYFAYYNGEPTPDARQDWTVRSIGREDGLTFCELSRPRTTCELDVDFQAHNPATVIAVLLAWAQSATDMTLAYHGPNKVATYMAFEPLNDGSDYGSGPAVETISTMSIVAPPAELPQVEGVDICSYHELPELDHETYYHITRVLTYWDNTPGLAYEQGMAHHITLFGCPTPVPEWTDGQLLPGGGSCDQMWSKCGNGDLVGQVVNIPEDEGIPFGKGSALAVVFLRHFYPDPSKAGVMDIGTTFELDYTADLRPFVAGKLVIQKIDLVIPKQTMDIRLNVLCPSECIDRNPPFTVTAASVHMHDRGNSDATGAIARLIRNGTELEPIWEWNKFVEGSVDEGWFPVDRAILPGDKIHFECLFDNPSTMTDVWGDGFYDQMCTLSLSTRSEGPMAVTTCLDQGPNTVEATCEGEACFKQAYCPVDTYDGLYPPAPPQVVFDPAVELTYEPYERPSCENPRPPPSTPPMPQGPTVGECLCERAPNRGLLFSKLPSNAESGTSYSRPVVRSQCLIDSSMHDVLSPGEVCELLRNSSFIAGKLVPREQDRCDGAFARYGAFYFPCAYEAASETCATAARPLACADAPAKGAAAAVKAVASALAAARSAAGPPPPPPPSPLAAEGYASEATGQASIAFYANWLAMRAGYGL